VSGIDVRVLGGVEVVGEDGRPLPLRTKQRRLLAALVVADGRACDVDELVEAVWDGGAPASARKLVQVYVSQLRSALPGSIRIATHAGGYALELPEGALDAARFERLLGDAAAAGRDGNAALALSLAEQALALWRGRAYGELGYDELARGEAERLDELRLAALEERLDAQLALGRHDGALAELLALAREHPLRERLQEQALVALYRSGRQSDALEHYRTVRDHLRDELGLEPGAGMRELQGRILRQDPALEAPVTGQGASTLPMPPNPLVGRERELEQLGRLLGRRDARLLVLTGAGGSGKTRLALEAARAAAPGFANGVVLVELASLAESGLVVPTIAHALDMGDPAGEEPLEALARVLAPQELLLVLDSVEHVREAATAFVELLARAPRLTIVVTSRVVLHVSGEHVFPVAPLVEDSALRLFEQRARSLDPGFELGPDNEADVREICRRLDGLPLAVELAAARIRSLTPSALRERLSSRLSLLTRGPRDLPARQQTLRETLDWSASLLTEHEREVFARLGVFAGGASLAAAEQVCEADLDTLGALVDHHLVRRTDAGGEPRFGLLETMREYADELRAREPAADAAIRSRHADWCLALAEEAERGFSGEEQARWFARLELEHDNLRAALAELEARGAAEPLLRLAVSLFRFWYVRGHLMEGRRRLEQALAHGDGGSPLLRRRALTAAAAIALLQGDYPAATTFAEAGLAVARETGEGRLIANALSNLGAIVLAAGDAGRATEALEEAVPLARGEGDERILALALNNLGDVSLTVGDYERAEPLFAESQELLRRLGDTSNIARSLFNLGAVDLMLGRLDEAGTRFAESLALSQQAGDKEDLAWCLEGLAGLAAATGRGERAALLLGAAESLLGQMGATFKPFERRLHETTVERAAALCDGSFGELVERGARLSLAEAVERGRAEPA
jgi:predicted ATPase/DNA-binding SARP family transcriptional activator